MKGNTDTSVISVHHGPQWDVKF